MMYVLATNFSILFLFLLVSQVSCACEGIDVSLVESLGCRLAPGFLLSSGIDQIGKQTILSIFSYEVLFSFHEGNPGKFF